MQGSSHLTVSLEEGWENHKEQVAALIRAEKKSFDEGILPVGKRVYIIQLDCVPFSQRGRSDGGFAEDAQWGGMFTSNPAKGGIKDDPMKPGVSGGLQPVGGTAGNTGLQPGGYERVTPINPLHAECSHR